MENKEYILKCVDPYVVIQECAKEAFMKLMGWDEKEFMSHVFVRLKNDIKFPVEFGKENLDCFYQVWEGGLLDIIHKNESILIGMPDGSRFKELKEAINMSEKVSKLN